MTETTTEIVLQCKNKRGWHDAWSHGWNASSIAGFEMAALHEKMTNAYGAENTRIIRRKTTVTIDVLNVPDLSERQS